MRKRTYDFDRLYWMSRHFLWLIPLTNLLIFLTFGVALSLCFAWSRRGRVIAPRLLGALTFLSPFWAAFPRVYGPAGVLLALGISQRLLPVIERHTVGFRRLVYITFPFVSAAVPALALSLWSGDRLKAVREAARPLPSPGSSNVLLIVLDTVGADHLSLYGYNRRTSVTLDELAARGIRFDSARATSSWTLPSHASMFTGRWPHELSAGWFNPLDSTEPTVAGFLGANGYATAGFIANVWYCGSDSGLGRGFTIYQDYIFPRLTSFATAVLVNRPIDGLRALDGFLEDRLNLDILKSATEYLWWVFKTNRKEASKVNQEFLDWLSERQDPRRPFFAFLNFYDAHFAYNLPTISIHRFGIKPRNNRDMNIIKNWRQLTQKNPSPYEVNFVRDSYDDCVAHLDEEIGCLIDELGRRGVLEQTWVIITSDHGESFGENPGVFWHGTSLYSTQIHVPLVIIPPAGGPAPRVVTETVSLRDLAPTIAELAGCRDGSPFRGTSLARYWNSPGPAPAVARDKPSEMALSEVVPNESYGQDPLPWLNSRRWPLAAISDGDWTYIRREGDVREELYRARRTRASSTTWPGTRPCDPNSRRCAKPSIASPAAR